MESMSQLALGSADKELFRMVSHAAFSNPFGKDRAELDLKIADLNADGESDGSTDSTSSSSTIGNEQPAVEQAIRRVRERIRVLGDGGPLRLDDIVTRDRDRVKYTVLFSTFYQYVDDFDRLIISQSETPTTIVSAAFGKRLIRDLEVFGLSTDQSCRFFELFFQMRRAHHFIAGAFIGTSDAMRTVRESLWNLIFTYDIVQYERSLWNKLEDFSTILIGETGTGKSAAARAIGLCGWIPYDIKAGRFKESFADLFVPVNLSEFSEGLIESELFGHRKGAFTGAREDYEGWLAQCSQYGIVFLDEIGELSIPIQVKLLRVLQDRTFTAVGSHVEKRFSGRVIAATHRSFDKLRQDGRMRDDFYYRLCAGMLKIPPFREQLQQDPSLLAQLIRHLVSRFAGDETQRIPIEVIDRVHDAISRDLPPDYPWPGNVRELEQVVRRVLLTGRADLPSAGLSQTAFGSSPYMEMIRNGSLNADQVMAGYCAQLYDRLGSYADVAARTELDPRTVKKYVAQAKAV